jgi:hypothetical protein
MIKKLQDYLSKDALINRSRAAITAGIPSSFSAQELNSHPSEQTLKAAFIELDQITLLK